MSNGNLAKNAFTAFASAPATMFHPDFARVSTISVIFIRFVGSASQHEVITRVNSGDAVDGIEGRSLDKST
jgi:hypothetical protein